VAVGRYQHKKNEDPEPVVLSLTKTGVKVKTDLAFGKSTENYVGHQIVEPGQFVFTPRDFDATPILCGISPTMGCISNLYLVFDVSADFDPRFLEYYFWGLKWGYGYFAQLCYGMRYSFNREQFERIPLAKPTLDEQRMVVRFLDRETSLIDGLIEKKTRFIALLKEKEKAAISRLVRRGLDRNAPTTDSGINWRGLVPAHWTRGRMKDHFRQEKRQGYEDLNVLSVYREFGVIEKSSRDDNINKTPEDLTKYQLVNPNDLVINKMKAWQGSMGVAPMTGITSPDYVVMRPIGEHDPRYMHHYLRAQPMPWVYRLISNGIRTDQWRMEPEKFLGLPVFMSPIEEQRRIADRIDVELERIRGLIALTERSIGLLREKRAALITAAVTGKIDVRAAA
jgi:type I restriction enzyme S subunit